MKGLPGIMVWGFALSFAAAAVWLTGTGPAKAEEGTLKPGETFKDCAQCPEMVVIPGGSFVMGSSAGERGRFAKHIKNESPQHRVTVPRFAMGRYEVTFAEWDACVAAGGCGRQASDAGWGRGRRPVVNVSWDDAKQYVGWLSRETGKRYRLPSEAEWEYAARAGTRTKYWWGDAIGRNKANCRGCGSQWDSKKTAPVGSFRPNPFGLYDVHGNVYEWVEDCWHENYAGAPADSRPWTSGGNCGKRVLRGGYWSTIRLNLRSASRFRSASGIWIKFFGFRVARTLP